MALKKIALVIGNSAYENKPLPNPKNDADDIAEKLTGYGFTVIKATDLASQDISPTLLEFREALSDAHVGLFFFAGHGIQVKGKNYLLSTNVEMRSESAIEYTSISLNEIIELMDESTVSTKIIILDACRDDPISGKFARSTEDLGLASVYAPKGTIIAYGTSPGELACDGHGRNGSYTEALLEHIDTQNCPIETMFKYVRNSLAAKTNGQQTSWEHTSLSGDFVFNVSLSKTITEYSETALADAQCDLSRNAISDKIIKGLKSYIWNTQRDTFKLFTEDNVDKISTDRLFVIGRNIYQAACGNCHAAKAYIHNFRLNTDHFEQKKQKAILDGMLFEIFFDSLSKLRRDIKGGMFNSVFEIGKNGQLIQSFHFIASALHAAKANFYVLPGTGRKLIIDISSNRVEGGLLITGVYIAGDNVLHPIDELYMDDNGDSMHHFHLKINEFKERLSLELALPLYLLELSFTVKPVRNEDIIMPINYTVRLEQ